jgi:hypothetical protein
MMASLAQAEAAHFGRLDAAYQRWLDDEPPEPKTLNDLEQANGGQLNWLESSRGFDRYATEPDESVWVCGDCGAIVDDIDDGCQACGFASDFGLDDE